MEESTNKIPQDDNNSPIHVKELLKLSFDKLQKILKGEVEQGIPSGFNDFDSMTHGFLGGELITFAAKEGVGKTSLMLNIAMNVASSTAEQPRPVALICLGMNKIQATNRLLCAEARVSERAFHDGSFTHTDMPKITDAVDVLKKSDIYIQAKSRITVNQLKKNTYDLVNNNGVALLIIDDVLSVVAPGSTNIPDQLNTVYSELKQLATDLNIPIIISTRCMHGKAEKERNAAPTVHSLYGEGAIDNNSDVLAFIYRSHDTTRNITVERLKAGLETDLIVEKNHYGETGISELLFFPQHTRFEDKPRQAVLL